MKIDHTMQIMPPSIKDSNFLYASFLFLVSVILFLYLSSNIVFPGHGDPCYYYDLAENLFNGRGFVIDYISYFHRSHENLTHPAGDYWMPLTAIVYWLVFLVGSPSFAATQVVASLSGASLIVIVFYTCRKIFKLPHFWSILAAVFLLVDIDFIFNIVIPHSSIFFSLVVTAFFLVFWKSGLSRSFMGNTVIGFLIGLGHLCRPDGILLWAVFFIHVGILWFYSENRLSRKEWISLLSSVVAGYSLVMGPWLIRNIMVFGTPLPVPSSHFPYLTDYEQIYSVKQDYSMKTLLQWGLVNIITSKASEAWRNIETLFHFRWIGLTALFALGYVKKIIPLQRMAIYLFVLWSVLSFILTLPGNEGRHGSFHHALPGLLPLMYVTMILGLKTVSDCCRSFLKRPTLSSLTFVLLHVMIGLTLCYSLFAVAYLYGSERGIIVRETNELHNSLQDMATLLPTDAVVMTRNPWELYHVTKRRAIQIPYDDLQTFHRIAEEYEVTHLVITDLKRPWLTDYIESDQGSKRFTLLYEAELAGHTFPYSFMRLYSLHP